MKKNVAKNQYGYIHSQTRLEGLKTLLMFVSSFGVLLLGISLTGSKNNYLTIFAVLGMLPAAKFLIGFVMLLRARCAVCPPEMHEKIKKITDGCEQAPLLRYDLYMTSSEACYPIYALACKDHCIIGYSGHEKCDAGKAEEHIKALAAQNRYEVSVVKIFKSEEKFLDRVQAFSDSEDAVTESDALLARLMENLSL